MFTGLHVEEHGIRRAHHRFTGQTFWDEIPHRTGVFSENMWITDMGVGLENSFDDIHGQQNVLFREAIDPGNFALSEGQGQYMKYLKRCLSHDHSIKSIINGIYIKIAWDYPQLLPGGHTTGTPAKVYTDLFTDWVDERTGPWAACINYMDAHLPYEPESQFDRWDDGTARKLQDDCEDQVWSFNSGEKPVWQMRGFESLYDGAIAQIDHEIGRLVDALKTRDEWDDTLLIVTADHGEGFGEPSEVRPDAIITGHGAGIHELQLHVPLLVKFPWQETGATHNEPVSLTDIPDVVSAAIEEEWKTDEFVTQGPVLASSHGLEEPMEERASKFVDDLWLYNGDYRTLYASRGDYVEKQVDWRGEYQSVVDVYDAQANRIMRGEPAPKVNEAFANLTDAGIRKSADDVEVSGATEQRLEDLGYM
jgi:arylsulfatase